MFLGEVNSVIDMTPRGMTDNQLVFEPRAKVYIGSEIARTWEQEPRNARWLSEGVLQQKEGPGQRFEGLGNVANRRD